MIVVGGEDDKHWPHKDLYVLNLASLTWQKELSLCCAHVFVHSASMYLYFFY